MPWRPHLALWFTLSLCPRQLLALQFASPKPLPLEDFEVASKTLGPELVASKWHDHVLLYLQGPTGVGLNPTVKQALSSIALQASAETCPWASCDALPSSLARVALQSRPQKQEFLQDLLAVFSHVVQTFYFFPCWTNTPQGSHTQSSASSCVEAFSISKSIASL